jgi:DNA polymerase III subunit alpha
VSSHPLAPLRDALARKVDCGLRELSAVRDGQTVTVGGLVASLRPLVTKRGDHMVFAELDDVTGSVEVVVFATTWGECRDTLVADAIVLVKGRVEVRGDGEVKLIASEVLPFDAVPDVRAVTIRIDARRAAAEVIAELKALIGEFPGPSPVELELQTSAGRKRLRFGPGFRVNPEGGFVAEAKALLGEAALTA